jgi:hypothetical protein
MVESLINPKRGRCMDNIWSHAPRIGKVMRILLCSDLSSWAVLHANNFTVLQRVESLTNTATIELKDMPTDNSWCRTLRQSFQNSKISVRRKMTRVWWKAP